MPLPSAGTFFHPLCQREAEFFAWPLRKEEMAAGRWRVRNSRNFHTSPESGHWSYHPPGGWLAPGRPWFGACQEVLQHAGFYVSYAGHTAGCRLHYSDHRHLIVTTTERKGERAKTLVKQHVNDQNSFKSNSRRAKRLQGAEGEWEEKKRSKFPGRREHGKDREEGT